MQVPLSFLTVLGIYACISVVNSINVNVRICGVTWKFLSSRPEPASLYIRKDNRQQDRKGNETKRGPRLINRTSYTIGRLCFMKRDPVFLILPLCFTDRERIWLFGPLNRELIQVEGLFLWCSAHIAGLGSPGPFVRCPSPHVSSLPRPVRFFVSAG